ncbi:MAG TPA: hypothetical protein VMN81_13240 [Vicinamibacterales bacterium]|nr:hypothetical protein [Vicinamibacterales bacterium]
MKTVITERLEQESQGRVGEHTWGDEGPTVDLYSCLTGSDFVGESMSEGPLGRQADIATEVAYWTAALDRYPREAWASDVARYERDELASAAAGSQNVEVEGEDQERAAFLKRLASQVNAAVRQAQLRLPTVVVEGGCGAAGEVPVRFSSDPRGAQVMLIPTFFYDVCKARRIDPDDPARCKRWREALEGTPVGVAGDYYYVARWADGIVRRGKLTFDEESASSVTLAKPR